MRVLVIASGSKPSGASGRADPASFQRKDLGSRPVNARIHEVRVGLSPRSPVVGTTLAAFWSGAAVVVVGGSLERVGTVPQWMYGA